jgi:nucleotide-binding universal stress UspA family protein
MNLKILVPLDSTSTAADVLAAAIAEARWRGAGIVLLRAIDLPMEYPVEVYALSPNNVADILEENARTELSRVASGIPSDIPSSVLVEAGTPWRVICSVAKGEDVAMVVMGAPRPAHARRAPRHHGEPGGQPHRPHRAGRSPLRGRGAP